MNKTIQDMYEQAVIKVSDKNKGNVDTYELLEQFAKLFQDAIYNNVKKELIERETIDNESDEIKKVWLRGVDNGLADALYRIRTFGDDE